jgi:hypothetical protein
MAGTTAGHGLPYPTGADRVADGDDSIKALAEKTDTELAKIDNRARFVAAMKARYVADTFTVPGVAAGGSTGPKTVTFPANAGFTSPPVVVAIPSSGRLGLAITGTTTTGFTYVADNWSPGTSSTSTGRYVAVGPGA